MILIDEPNQFDGLEVWKDFLLELDGLDEFDDSVISAKSRAISIIASKSEYSQ